MKNKWIFLALIAVLILSACGGADSPLATPNPDEYDYCYTYEVAGRDFTYYSNLPAYFGFTMPGTVPIPGYADPELVFETVETESGPVSQLVSGGHFNAAMRAGSWITDTGFLTDASDAMNVRFWTIPNYAPPHLAVLQATIEMNVPASVDIQASGNIFGLPVAIDQTYTGTSGNQFFTIHNDTNTLIDDEINIELQTSGTVAIRSVKIYMRGPAFGVDEPALLNECGDPTPTPEPTDTPTVIPTATSSPTTTLTPSPTFTLTTTPTCDTAVSVDLSGVYTGSTITPSASGRLYYQLDLGSTITVPIVSPWPGYKYKLTSISWRQGSYYNGTTNGYSAEGTIFKIYDQANTQLGTQTNNFPSSPNGGQRVTATEDNSPGLNTLANGTPNTQVNSSYITIQENDWAGLNYTNDELVWIHGLTANLCRGDFVAAPTSTPSGTSTPTSTSTRTATRTPLFGGTVTATRTPTQSPLPPIHSPTPVTPTITQTPAPSLPPPTAPPSSTYIPAPTAVGSSTAEATYPVPGFGTGLPGATGVATILPETTLDGIPGHSDVYNLLATAAAEVNNLPSDFRAYVPNPDISPMMGYVKWFLSCTSVQEFLGVNVGTMMCHGIVGISLLLILASVIISVRIITLVVKFAVWVFGKIIGLIPGI